MCKRITWSFPNGGAHFSVGAELTRGDVLHLLAQAWLERGVVVRDERGEVWTVENLYDERGGCEQCLLRPGRVLYARKLNGGSDFTPLVWGR